IRANLTNGLENASAIKDAKLWEVAKMSYADQFIKEFSNGLDTEVVERGVKLSGGQKQRIAIARAFLRDPKMLMMDETTARLDSKPEISVQKELTELIQGKMTFVNAQRLTTIVNANEILFIENGEITGRGTHEELIKHHDLYRKFAKQQLT